MRLRWKILFLLGCLGWVHGARDASGQTRPKVDPASTSEQCRAADIELYNGGGDAALGHNEQVIELRNHSKRTCTLLGPPQVFFLDDRGKRLPEPYAKNRGDQLSTTEPVQLVTLAPGDFANFKLGMTTCNDEAGCLQFSRLNVVLPGDNVPLSVERTASALTGINATAVRTGADTEDGGFVPPVTTVDVASGLLKGLTLRLDVPQNPLEGFTAHFAIRNIGPDPVQLGAKSCGLRESLTNSAETTISSELSCGTWIGALASDGKLAPGAVGTMDVRVAGDGSDSTQGQMCRAGQWKAELELEMDVGKVTFRPVPFEVKGAQCSDSEIIDVAGSEAIRWTPIPQHGVRLGVLVRGRGNTEPAEGRFYTGAQEAAFRVGDPIEVRFFLDNMTDEPVRLNVGPGTFRLLLRHAGLDVSPDLVAPTRVPGDGPAREVTVPPHAQSELATRMLSATYSLPEGDYELSIGPLHLPGASTTTDAAATASTTGGLIFEDVSAAGGLIKVLPR